MDEKRIDVRSWQVGLAGLVVGAVVFAAILALWRPWVKLPPVGEVRGAILEADIKQIQKLTAKLTKEPINVMELIGPGEIEVSTGEHTGPFYTFQWIGGKWTKTVEGYWTDMMGPAVGPAPVPVLAPPNTLPVDHATVVDSIQYYPAAPTSAVAPADTSEAGRLTPLEDAHGMKKAIDELSPPSAPGEVFPHTPRVPAPGER